MKFFIPVTQLIENAADWKQWARANGLFSATVDRPSEYPCMACYGAVGEGKIVYLTYNDVKKMQETLEAAIDW